MFNIIHLVILMLFTYSSWQHLPTHYSHYLTDALNLKFTSYIPNEWFLTLALYINLTMLFLVCSRILTSSLMDQVPLLYIFAVLAHQAYSLPFMWSEIPPIVRRGISFLHFFHPLITFTIKLASAPPLHQSYPPCNKICHSSQIQLVMRFFVTEHDTSIVDESFSSRDKRREEHFFLMALNGWVEIWNTMPP